jgi:hypothetical protein
VKTSVTSKRRMAASLVVGALSLATLGIAASSNVGFMSRGAAEDARRPVTPPRGATARCKDGTYSFTTVKRSACWNHRGVQTWLR